MTLLSRSFAGEAALTCPASTEALHMVHTSLTADVAALMAEVEALHATVKETSVDVKEMRQQLSNLIAWTLDPAPTHSASSPNSIASLACRQSSAAPSMIQPAPIGLQPTRLTVPQVAQLPGAPPFVSLPSHVGPQRTASTSTSTSTSTRTSNLPPGLLIPNVPVLHVDGTRTPKSDSWRDIVRHWTEGEPRLGLHIPLKDWPHHYYNGRHGRQFNTKHYQRSVVATEFLDEFQGDEDAFLKAYGGAAREGHTKLLKAILGARRRHRGHGQRRSHLANEPQ